MASGERQRAERRTIIAEYSLGTLHRVPPPLHARRYRSMGMGPKRTIGFLWFRHRLWALLKGYTIYKGIILVLVRLDRDIEFQGLQGSLYLISPLGASIALSFPSLIS
jgi:hypothetical protein